MLEERRLGRGAGQRMRDKYFPALLNDSQYAKRLPIGTEQVLTTFKPATLEQFYKDWYRPDLMAVIAVGDFDIKRGRGNYSRQIWSDSGRKVGQTPHGIRNSSA